MNPTFFPQQRRKIQLKTWVPLLNAQDEKRVRFDMSMPITGQPDLAMPDFLTKWVASMEQEGSAADDIGFDAELEDFTVEFFATDVSQAPLTLNAKDKLLLTGATLRKFRLERVPEDDRELIYLQFSVTVRSTRALCGWAWGAHGNTMFAEFSFDPSPDQLTIKEVQLPLTAAPAPQPPAPEVVTVSDSAIQQIRAVCPFPQCGLEDEHTGAHMTRDGRLITVPANVQPVETASKPAQRKPQGFQPKHGAGAGVTQ